VLDLLFVLAALVFFAVAILYIYGCDWFIKDEKNSASVERIATNREAGT
jgi:phage shock protein PspC (stress-responsive transcriptional regulator)